MGLFSTCTAWCSGRLHAEMVPILLQRKHWHVVRWDGGCTVLSSCLICVKLALLYDVALMSVDVIMVWEACVNRTPTWKTFVGTLNIKQRKGTLLRGKNSHIANSTTVWAAIEKKWKPCLYCLFSGFCFSLYKWITAGVFARLHITGVGSALAFTTDHFFLLLSQKELEYRSKRASDWKYPSQDSRTIKTERKDGGGNRKNSSSHKSLVTSVVQPFCLSTPCVVLLFWELGKKKETLRLVSKVKWYNKMRY